MSSDQLRLIKRRLRASFQLELLRHEQLEVAQPERNDGRDSQEALGLAGVNLQLQLVDVRNNLATTESELKAVVEELQQTRYELRKLEVYAANDRDKCRCTQDDLRAESWRLEARLGRLEKTTSKLDEAYQRQTVSTENSRSQTMEV